MRLLVTLIVLFIAAQHVRSQDADVSAERVSMDAKMLRAIDGTASLGSAAVWPQSVYALTDLTRATNDAFSRYIKSYYGATLLSAPVNRDLEFAQTTDGRFRGISYADSIARLQGDISLMLRTGYYNNGTTSSSFALLRPAVRLMGSLGNNLGFFLDLSNGMRLKGNPALIARTDPTLSRTLKFNIEDSAFFDRYVGYIQYQNEWLRVRFGREALQFGFSPIDNFVHSIDAPLMDGLLIDVPYKSLRFTMTHSAANGIDTAGIAVPGKYIATHRLAFDPVDWLSIAVNDMIV